MLPSFFLPRLYVEQAWPRELSYGSMTSDTNLGFADEEDGTNTKYKPGDKAEMAETLCTTVTTVASRACKLSCISVVMF